MNRFYVGDRVIIKNVSSGYWSNKNTIAPGMTGIIVENRLNSVGVEFDKYINGHSCGGYGKYGYCYYVAGVCLHRISEQISSVNICGLI